jgi:hypothetical protein
MGQKSDEFRSQKKLLESEIETMRAADRRKLRVTRSASERRADLEWLAVRRAIEELNVACH